MTSPLDRVRAVALQLPEAEERGSDEGAAFVVADQHFALFSDGPAASLCLRAADADEAAALVAFDPAVFSRQDLAGDADWVSISLAGEVDWQLVEDRIARSWEMAAPPRLLEAGGR
jgi:hypothetical protein